MSEAELKVPKEKKKKKSGVKQSDVAEVAKKVKTSSEETSARKSSIKKDTIAIPDKKESEQESSHKSSSVTEVNDKESAPQTESSAVRRASALETNTETASSNGSPAILSRTVSASGKVGRNISFDSEILTNESTVKNTEQAGPENISENIERKLSSAGASSTPRHSDAELKTGYTVPAAATKKDVDLLKDLDEEKLIELKEAFELFDLNQDGIIDRNDLRNTLISLGQTEVQDDEIFKMLAEASNPLDFDSFVILLGYKSIELDPEQVLLEALAKWDYGDEGLISEDRIKHDLQTWGDKFTPTEADLALEDAPACIKNHSTMIDYIQFCKMLCGLRKKSQQQQQ